MNTVSEEGIAKINTTSRLVLRRRGDSAVEFYNAANRLYVLHFFDVHVIDRKTAFTVVVKSKGPLQNPIYKYSDDNLMNIAVSDLRQAVLSRVCKDIHCKYMNGINCIYLNYSRSVSPG